MTRRAWTGTERKFLRENYISLGSRECADRLNRTIAAVRMFALKNGFARSNVTLRPTPQIDAFIRRAYANGRGHPQQAARTLGVSVQWVARRAGELGITHKRDCRPYTDAEARFVEEHAHLSRGTISAKMRERGWRRTANSIQKFIAYGRIQNDNYITPESLSLCLGVVSGTIRAWAREGFLIGAHRGNGSDADSGSRIFSLEEVAAFIVRHPSKVDLRKVDGPWLIDLIARHGAAGLVEAKTKSARIIAIKEANPERTASEIAAMVDSTPGAVSVVLSKARTQSSLAA